MSKAHPPPIPPANRTKAGPGPVAEEAGGDDAAPPPAPPTPQPEQQGREADRRTQIRDQTVRRDR